MEASTYDLSILTREKLLTTSDEDEMVRIVRFKNKGSLSRVPSLHYMSYRFWIEEGTIALQLGPVQRRSDEAYPDYGIAEKDIVPLLMGDGTKAFAVCAPCGWELWVEEL